jgi:hypothetical protein
MLSPVSLITNSFALDHKSPLRDERPYVYHSDHDLTVYENVIDTDRAEKRRCKEVGMKHCDEGYS